MRDVTTDASKNKSSAVFSAEAPTRSRNARGLTVMTLATAAAFAASLYAILIVAPIELQMGIVQKIFYIHVPSAYCMYVGFVVSAVASGVFLLKRSSKAEALALASAEVGMMFCAIVLITGPLWARKAWGVYWTWDPRLTTTLLAGMVFAAFLVLRSLGEGLAERKFAAGLAIFGLLDLPVIHYSVQRWRGQHPTVITGKGGGLAPGMYPALWLSFLAFTFLVALLIWMRAHIEMQKRDIEELRWNLEDQST